ncbi:hypothetical protein ACFL1R_09590 [Candidatus Latescibacterota bacterium]
MGNYDYSINDCDVIDKPALTLFRQHRDKWLEMLKGPDVHAIWTSIYKMHWNDVVYRLLNYMKKLVEEKPHPDVGFNSTFISLIDSGFTINQAMAIRRLTDKIYVSGREVVSLARLLREIKENKILFTREIYVCFDGPHYDPAQDKDMLGIIQEAHKNFDRLCDNTHGNRTRWDRLSFKCIEKCERMLTVCEPVQTFVNKFLAHAADPVTRKSLSPSQSGLTLKKLEDCYKAIYRVTNFISGILLREPASAPVPIPQFNQFKNIEKRWLLPEHSDLAKDFWDKRVKQMEKWVDDIWPDSLEGTGS